MAGEFESVGSRHGFLQFFYLVVFKFNDDTALCANKMIMVMIGHSFETGLTIFKVALVGNTCFNQEHQCAINCGIADGRVLAAREFEHFLDGDVFSLKFEKSIGDMIALAC